MINGLISLPDISYKVFDPCFVVQYLMLFLVLESSHWGRESWSLNFNCVPDSVLCLFLTMPCVGMQCMILAFSGHTQILYGVM